MDAVSSFITMTTTEASSTTTPLQTAALAGGFLSAAVIMAGLVVQKVRSPSTTTSTATKPIPGPPAHPLWLNTFDILFNLHRLTDWAMDMSAKYGGKTGLGTWRVLIRCAPDFVMVNEPENLKRVLQNVDIYPKGPVFRNIFWSLTGQGFFNNDGPYHWQQQRKGFAGVFKATNLRTTLSSIVKSNTATLLNVIDQQAGTGRSLNMWTTYQRFTFDVACDMTYGKNLGAQRGDKEANHFLEAFEYCQHYCHDLFVFPLHHLLHTYFTPSGWKYMKDSAFCKDLGMKCVKQTLLDKSRGELPCDNALTMLADKGPYSETYLRDATLCFIFGAWDTTAITLNWMTWLLTQHPEIEAKLLAEAREVLGGVALEDITYEHVNRLEYAHAFMMETLRLYPPSAKNMKQAAADDVLPDGSQVRKGDFVVFWPYVMGRSEALWSEAYEVKPERFLSQDGNGVTKPSPFTFATFQAGPRICLGSDLAYLEAKLALAQIVIKYKVRLANPEEKVVPQQDSLTMPTSVPLQVIFDRRED